MILLNLYCTVLAVFCCHISAQNQCPDKWSSDTRNRSCYLLGNGSLNWDNAENECKANFGAHLASITDDREQRDFSLYLLLNQALQGQQYVWIGLRDDDGQHLTWRWTDGSRFDANASADLWLPSQPDNPRTENCGLANKLALVQVMDFACNTTHAFVCKIYAWSQWSEWAACQQTCGGGTRIRNRACPIANGCGTGSFTESIPCNTNLCPRFDQWSSWSECNRTCNGGSRTRRRECVNGPRCVGENEETEPCNNNRCAEWGAWEWWASCSAECGNGTQTRLRQCLYATDCNGTNQQERTCNIQPCLLETPCPATFERQGDSCYKILQNATTWPNAKQECESNNGRLVNNFDEEIMCNLNRYLNSKDKSSEIDGGGRLGLWTRDDDGNGKQSNEDKRELSFDADMETWVVKNRNWQSQLRPLCEQVLESNGCFASWNSSKDYCYRLLTTKVQSFEDAENYCLESGGHLTSIAEIDEYNFVIKLFIQGPQEAKEFWLGLREIDFAWSYIDGKSVQTLFDNSTSTAIPTSFAQALTQNSSNDENKSCAKIINDNGVWRLERENCDVDLAFACKIKKPKKASTKCLDEKARLPIDNSRSTAAPWRNDQPTCPAGWQFINGNGEVCGCFSLMKTPTQFVDIDRTCSLTYNGRPASIRTKAENQLLMAMLRRNKLETAWIGLTDPIGSSEYKWLDGASDQQSLNTINTFLPNRNSDAFNQRCVFVNSSANGGSWSIDWCYNARAVLCRFNTVCSWPTTARVYPTLGAVEKVVVTVVQTLGSAYVAAIMAVTLIAFAIRRNFSVERVIMSTEEFSLMMAHLLLATAKDNYGNRIACLAVAIALHYFFLVYFVALFLESVQAYVIVTSVIPRGGFFSKKLNLILAWTLPIIAVGLTAFFCGFSYITPVMCFLDLDGSAAIPVIFLMAVISVCAMIATEAAGIGEDFYPRLINYDKTQMTTCIVCQKGLLFIIPLSITGYVFTITSVSQQNVAMFSLCLAVNVTLACVIFAFHALSNPEVRLLFVRLYRKMQQKICRVKFKVEDGSFDAEYKDRDLTN